jgi:hypothetical protein
VVESQFCHQVLRLRVPISVDEIISSSRSSGNKQLMRCTLALLARLQEGRQRYSGEPSPEDLARFWSVSPVAHISSVSTPMMFMLGAKDR